MPKPPLTDRRMLAQRCAAQAHRIPSMKDSAQLVDLRVGELYRDLDGTPVRLVRIVGEVCCWIPVGKGAIDRECTLIDRFLDRFRPFAKAA